MGRDYVMGIHGVYKDHGELWVYKAYVRSLHDNSAAATALDGEAATRLKFDDLGLGLLGG